MIRQSPDIRALHPRHLAEIVENFVGMVRLGYVKRRFAICEIGSRCIRYQIPIDNLLIQRIDSNVFSLSASAFALGVSLDRITPKTHLTHQDVGGWGVSKCQR